MSVVRQPGERGFTLLETLVVMVIIGVVAALVLPSMQAGSRQAEVRRSVRAFISASRQASAIAVRTREPKAVVVWPDSGRFGVDGVGGTYELPPFAEFGEIIGGRDSEGDEELYFDFFPTGASAGGSVTIVYRTSGGDQVYRLVLDPLIGRVRIEDES